MCGIRLILPPWIFVSLTASRSGARATCPLHSPRWTEFFGSHINANDLRSSGVAAIFIVRAGGRFFALTFGHGRYLLEPDSYEEGFGLRVTLNSVSPERIRTIDRKAIDATGRHSRDQASSRTGAVTMGRAPAPPGAPGPDRAGRRGEAAGCTPGPRPRRGRLVITMLQSG
ncbi:MAG: TIGR04141 family sporadically distributed protein [Candidatus Rokubacteria bacterium]|nr:TIGR04141 family sporadically distributed protein [Candidatus Rokubacteria bacterium]